MKKVREIMNKNVICFTPENTVFEVAKVLYENNISGAPVVENEKVVGIISESDIVKFISTKLGIESSHKIPSLGILIFEILKIGKDYLKMKKEMKTISEVKIKNLMSKKIISIDPEASLFDAANLMEKHDVNRLPVIENERLIGIVTRADLIKALIE